jgi:hypothetical protein
LTALPKYRVRLTIAPPSSGSAKTQQAVVIDDLHTGFKSRQDLKHQPNHAGVVVYNLNPEIRDSLGANKKGSRIWVEAGLGGVFDAVFSGDILWCASERESCDWKTEIECSDGGQRYKFAHTNKSFSAGVTLSAVTQHLADASGLGRGNLAQSLQDSMLNGKFLQGYSSCGAALSELSGILESVGLTWSIQNNAIQVLPRAGYLPAPAVLLDEKHGLIGCPTFGSPPQQGGKRLLKAKAVLLPAIRPGVKVRLNTPSLPAVLGSYVAVSVEHEGDTFGDTWFTTMELRPL